MRVYISGPITGICHYLRNFSSVESKLRTAGHKVVNPARINDYMPEGTTHAQYMRLSIAELSTCEVMVQLNGWKNSDGCQEEKRYADEHDIDIVNMEELLKVVPLYDVCQALNAIGGTGASDDDKWVQGYDEAIDDAIGVVSGL